MSSYIIDTITYRYPKVTESVEFHPYLGTHLLIRYDGLDLPEQHTYMILADQGGDLLEYYGIHDRPRYANSDSNHYTCENERLILSAIRRDHKLRQGLEIRVPFTGTLLAGNNLRMFHNLPPLPYHCKVVLELRFIDGRLISTVDHSAAAEVVRQRVEDSFKKTHEAGTPPSELEWVSFDCHVGFYQGRAIERQLKPSE